MKQIKLISGNVKPNVTDKNSNTQLVQKNEQYKPRLQLQEKMKSIQAVNSRQRLKNEKGQLSPESPSTTRFSKTPSKIVQPPLNSQQQIIKTQKQIDSLILQLDTKLKTTYHTKQQKLLESYRQQLIKAHKDLINLKNNTNEQQIKNQMNEKALQLKKQRLQLIQTNMYYSNKCLQYKKLLDQKINEGGQLQRELKFLQKQILNSQQKQIHLMTQVYDQNSPIKSRNNQQIIQTPLKQLSTSQKPNSLQTIVFQSQKKTVETSNNKTSFSTHANTQVMKKIKSNSTLTKFRLQNEPQLSNKVKKLFEDKLAGNSQVNITDKTNTPSKKSNILTKISQINGEIMHRNEQSQFQKQQSQKEQSQIQALFYNTVSEVAQKRGSKKQISLMKGQQFTQIQKKQIMKLFLSKQEVKQYIYNIIFDKVQDSAIFKKKPRKQKFKILPSDVKPEAGT